MNIQDEVIKINAKYGVSGKANYEIQKLFDKEKIEFAKLHVIEALKEANEAAAICLEKQSGGELVIYDANSILNAYTLDQIK